MNGKADQARIRSRLEESWRTYGRPLLEALVNQNSYSANVAGVSHVQAIIERELASFDVEVELERSPEQSRPPRGPILCGRTRAHREAGSGYALVFHADTVHPPDSSFSSFRLDGERAIGPGVFDMKAGIVSACLAVRLLHEQGLLSGLPLLFVVNSAEEDGSPEASRIMKKIVSGSRAALVFEFGRSADDGREGLVTMRNGMACYKAEIFGRPSHVREYEKGANAIEEAASLALRLADLRNPSVGVTVNQGRISGGRSLNVVPDHAILEWEIRAPTTAFFEELESVRETRWACPNDERVRVSLSREAFSPPLEESTASLLLFERYVEAGRRAGIRFGKRPREFGLSDGNLVAGLPSDEEGRTVPVIDALGPMGGGAHTNDEWVSVPSIVERAHALVAFLLDPP